MTIILTLDNQQTVTTNVAPSFTMEMINECFLNKNYYDYGIVINCQLHHGNVY